MFYTDLWGTKKKYDVTVVLLLIYTFIYMIAVNENVLWPKFSWYMRASVGEFIHRLTFSEPSLNYHTPKSNCEKLLL